MFTKVLELNPNSLTFCSFIKGHFTLRLLRLVELMYSITFNSIDRLALYKRVLYMSETQCMLNKYLLLLFDGKKAER